MRTRMRISTSVIVSDLLIMKRGRNTEKRTWGEGCSPLVKQLPETLSSGVQPLPISTV